MTPALSDEQAASFFVNPATALVMTRWVLKVPRGATAQDLAEKLGASAAEIVKILFLAGEMVSATQSLSDEAIELVAKRAGRRRITLELHAIGLHQLDIFFRRGEPP